MISPSSAITKTARSTRHSAQRRTTDFVTNEEQIHKLLIQTDKKIVGVGFMRYGVNQNFALARYSLNGNLDTTFGSCGRITSDLGTNTDIAYGATIQPDGKIIAVGEMVNGATSADFAVVRYTSGGQATVTSADFDGDGKEDVSVYRPSEGVWYMNCSCQGFRAVKFGLAGDIRKRRIMTATADRSGGLSRRTLVYQTQFGHARNDC